jgi:hypothetical protein
MRHAQIAPGRVIESGVLAVGDVASVELPPTVEVLPSQAIVGRCLSGAGADRRIRRGVDSPRVADPLPARPASRGSPALAGRHASGTAPALADRPTLGDTSARNGRPTLGNAAALDGRPTLGNAAALDGRSALPSGR